MAQCPICHKKVFFLKAWWDDRKYCSDCWSNRRKDIDILIKKEFETRKTEFLKEKERKAEPSAKRLEELEYSKHSARVNKWLGIALVLFAVIFGWRTGGYIMVSLELIIGLVLLFTGSSRENNIDEKIKDFKYEHSK